MKKTIYFCDFCNSEFDPSGMGGHLSFAFKSHINLSDLGGGRFVEWEHVCYQCHCLLATQFQEHVLNIRKQAQTPCNQEK